MKKSIVQSVFTLAFLLMFTFSNHVNAQEREYVVVGSLVFDRFEQQPIENAMVALNGNPIGVSSTAQGYFSFAMTKGALNTSDILTISARGYYDWKVPADKFQAYFENNEAVLMTPLPAHLRKAIQTDGNTKVAVAKTEKWWRKKGNHQIIYPFGVKKPVSTRFGESITTDKPNYLAGRLVQGSPVFYNLNNNEGRISFGPGSVWPSGFYDVTQIRNVQILSSPSRGTNSRQPFTEARAALHVINRMNR